jgi:transcriptional regulator with XRE-family HTH domain
MLSHLSEIPAMDTWHVIEEALHHMRPRRSPLWLAEKLGVKIQVVSNWKARGVPVARLREIAAALGITLDQLEGLEPVPWETQSEREWLPEVEAIAAAINDLPKAQREWVVSTVHSTIAAAKATIRPSNNQVTQKQQPDSTQPARKAGKR